MSESVGNKTESNVKNKPKEQEKSGGLLKNIIKALFNSVVDLPQQEQLNRNINRKQDLDGKRKKPEDLNQEKKLEVKEAAKGLKEGLQKSNTDTKIVAQTITQSTKTKER